MGLDDHRPQTEAGRQDPGLWRQERAEEVSEACVLRPGLDAFVSVGIRHPAFSKRDGVSSGMGILRSEGRQGGRKGERLLLEPCMVSILTLWK